MSHSRTRAINFRVTNEEFERLKTAASQQGARCLSDFARSKMLSQSNICPVLAPNEDRFLSFEQRVAALENSLGRLLDALSGAHLQRAHTDN